MNGESRDPNVARSADGEEQSEEAYEFGNDGGGSLLLTAVLLGLAVGCGIRAGSLGWAHLAVAGVGYAAFFGFEWVLDRRQGPECRETGSGAFVESRQTIALVGVGAFAFESPVLMELAPDVLIAAAIFGGSDDGRAAREVGRRFGLSAMASTGLLLRMWWRGGVGTR